MKRIVRIGAIALALGFCLPAHAQDAEQIARSVYAKFAKLMDRGDVDGMAAMLAPEYHAVDQQGKAMGKGEVVEMMRQMCPTFRAVKTKFVISEAYRSGDEVTAWITMDVKAKTKTDGKWQPVSMTMRVIETMTKKPGGWKFVQTRSLDE